MLPQAPYREQPNTKIWTNPNVLPYQDRFPVKTKPYRNEAEYKVCDWLVKKVLKKHLDGVVPSPLQHRKVLDLANRSGDMVRALQDNGYKESELIDFNNTPIPREPPSSIAMFTMVNTFQRLDYQGAVTLLDLCYDMLMPNGCIFMRISDRDVPGAEKELDPSVTEVTPILWNLESFLELLGEIERFQIVETYTLPGGHRDIVLKKLSKPLSICAGMIVKNEERDLPRCLNSLVGVVDSFVLIDTGSTDTTLEVAQRFEAKFPVRGIIETYTGASEKDETGDWKLWNFGQARNQYCEKIESLGKFDYVLWMDADDEILDPKKLRNLIYLGNIDIHGIQMQDGTLKWIHHRLWKTGKGVRYAGRCHEYPNYGGLYSMEHSHVRIRHDAAAGMGENANKRNLRILEREFKDSPSPRTAFYLANTHKDGGRWAEAIPYYKARMDFGKGFEEEYWFAALYKARCERWSRKHEESRRTLMSALAERPDWCEFWVELAYLETDQGQHYRAIGWCMQAMNRPVAPSTLFREPDKYLDQPYRIASWSYEHLKDMQNALDLAIKAKEKIGGPDAEWDARIEKLDKASYDVTISPKH